MHGSELWKSDGTEAGTILVEDIFPGSLSSDISNFHVEAFENVNDELYFIARDQFHGLEIWKTDADDCRAVRVTNNTALIPNYITSLDQRLLVVAKSAELGEELYYYDIGNNPINNLSQAITFEPVSPARYGDVIKLTATSTSALPVSFISSDESIITISGSNALIKGIGTATVMAIQEGNHIYCPADSISTALISTKAELLITAEGKVKTYGDENPTLTYSLSGLKNGDDATVLTVQPSLQSSCLKTSFPGPYGITISGGAADNYNLVLTPGTLSVVKRALAVTSENKSRPYKQENPAFTLTYSGFIQGDDKNSIDEIPAVHCSAVITSDAGEYVITVSGGTDNCYSFTNTSGILTVNQASQQITLGTIESKRYGDSNFVPTVSSSSGLQVSLSSSNTSIVTIDNDKIKISGVGEVMIKASQEGNLNYLPADPQTKILRVDKGLQLVKFAYIGDGAEGDKLTLNASASSGLDINFVSTSTKVVIEENHASLIMPGKASVRAQQKGNEFYEPVTAESNLFCINPSKPVITAETGNGMVLLSSAAVGNQWYKNEMLLDGEVLQSIMVTGTGGSYAVISEREGCYSKISEPYHAIVLGMEQAGEGFHVSPNPFTTMLTIKLPVGADYLRFYDLTGELIYDTDNVQPGTFQIKTESLVRGFYFLTVTDKQHHITSYKLVKSSY